MDADRLKNALAKAAAILAWTGILGLNAPAQDSPAVDPNPSSASARQGVVQIERDLKSPPIAALARINQASVFFLDLDGRVGVAKFSPGLSLVAWDHYTSFRWREARRIAYGRNLSVVSGTPYELSQAFDTDQDGRLDFFQDMITDWPGKKEGARISSGPLTDPSGRLLFAVSPSAGSGNAADRPCTLFSWNPGGTTLTKLATSSLPIVEMAVSSEGLLAAWIQLPSYDEGYYLSLIELPPFESANPDHQPENPPSLLPDIIIPAELTGFKPVGSFCFSKEDGETKLLVTCPQSKRLIEATLEMGKSGWGGIMSVREIFPQPVYCLEPMEEGKVLLGGAGGFRALGKNLDAFRFLDVRLVGGSLEIDFSKPVDRAKATDSESGVQLAIIPLAGQLDAFDPPQPLVESDGRTVVLKLPSLPSKAILKVEAPGLTSEEGEKVLFPSVFYTIK